MSILTYKNSETKWSIFLTKNNDLLLDDNFIQASFFPDPHRHHHPSNYGYFVTTLPRMRECEFIKTRKCGAKMKTAPPVKYLPAGLMVRWPSTHICVAMLIISPPPPSVNKIGRKLKNLLFQSETKGSLNAF